MDDTDSLREVIDLYGLEPAVGVLPQVFPSGSGNRVCHVQTTTGHIAVRRSHPARTRPWLDLEAAVLDHLAQVRFPAVRQYRTAAGQPFIEHAGRFWSVFKYIEASILTRPDEAQLATLAHLQARLHVVLATFPAADRWMDWAGQWRPRKSWAYIVPLADTLAFLEQVAIEPCRAQNLPPAVAEQISLALQDCHHRLQQIVPCLPVLPGMLTHYDYGQYNVLFDAAGAATVIDFDMLCWEPVAANLARAISVIARREWLGQFEPLRAAAYLAAYQAQRPLSDQERAALPRLLRLFVLQYVIFHSLLCLEESKSGEPERWLQAIHDDLRRDAELLAAGIGWMKQ